MSADTKLSVMEIKWGLVPDMAGVVLMRGHGCTVVAESLRVAIYRSVYTELNAKLLLQALPADRLDFYFYLQGSNSPAAQWIGRTWAEFVQ